MGKKLFHTEFMKVSSNDDVELMPITLEEEHRGVIHGSVKNMEGKVCVVKLFKIQWDDRNKPLIMPMAFQYLDDFGQFLFPITDTYTDCKYFIKVFCLEPCDLLVDPTEGI